MDQASTLLADLALVLGMAAVTTVLCRWLRQPTVLGYLVAGLVVGPYVPIPLFADAERVATLSELGVVLVMFGIGLEFSLRRLVRVVARTGVVAMMQIGTMLWLGYVGGRLLGWSRLEAVFAGAALCISSTMIVARLLADRRGRDRLSELVFSVLVLQDFVAVVLIAVLTTLATGAASRGEVPTVEVAATAGRLLLFLLTLVVAGFLVVPKAVRAVARLGSEETLMVACVGLCFGLAELAHVSGFSVALGAFLAGSLVAESGEGSRVEHLVRPMRDMFAAIFFVTVGMSVDPDALLGQPEAIALLVGLVLVGQVVAVSLGAVLVGYRLGTAIQAGTSLAQVGEFSFIIAGIGTAAGVVRPELLPVVVAVSAVTCFLTPYMARAGRPLALAVDRRLPRALQTFISLYGTWLESLRSSGHRHTLGAIVRRCLAWIVVDASLIAVLVVGASLARRTAEAWLQRALGVPPAVTVLLLVLFVGAAAMPFVLGLVRMSRHLGTVLARAALPHAQEGAADFGAAPRRAYLVTVQLVVLLTGLMFVVAVTQPFVPEWAGGALLVVVLGALGVSFWRGAVDLAEHARAGAEVVAEILARQADDGRSGRAGPGAGPPPLQDREDREEALRDVQDLLPGLGTLLELDLAHDAEVVGRSLAEVHLRGLTGATVIAIGRGQERITTPAGDETLRAGDRLCLSGTHAALDAARAVLTRRAGPVAADGGAPASD